MNGLSCSISQAVFSFLIWEEKKKKKLRGHIVSCLMKKIMVNKLQCKKNYRIILPLSLNSGSIVSFVLVQNK